MKYNVILAGTRAGCVAIPSLCCALYMGAGSASAAEQGYPIKTVRIYTSGAGGGNDLVARIIAQGISPVLGQPVVVENRVGIISVDSVSKAAPDGYSLLVIGSSLWIDPLMRDDGGGWDPIRDFAPITLAVISPNVLVVNPSLPVKTTRELIALAKSRPGDLNYASAGSGSTPHVAAELFKYMAGVNIVRILYKNTATALTELIGGQVHLTFTPAGTATPHVKSGKLRALGVTTAQQSALFPGLPTLAASGVPGYEAASTYGLFAPAKTPSAIVMRLNQETLKMLAQPGAKEKVFNTGSEVIGSTPDELTAKMRSETTRLAKVVKSTGMKPD